MTDCQGPLITQTASPAHFHSLLNPLLYTPLDWHPYRTEEDDYYAQMYQEEGLNLQDWTCFFFFLAVLFKKEALPFEFVFQ